MARAGHGAEGWWTHCCSSSAPWPQATHNQLPDHRPGLMEQKKNQHCAVKEQDTALGMGKLEPGCISLRCGRDGHTRQKEVLEDATSSGVKCLTGGQCPAMLHPCLWVMVSVCSCKKYGRHLDHNGTKTPSSWDLSGEIPGMLSKAYLFGLERNILFIRSSETGQRALFPTTCSGMRECHF